MRFELCKKRAAFIEINAKCARIRCTHDIGRIKYLYEMKVRMENEKKDKVRLYVYTLYTHA